MAGKTFHPAEGAFAVEAQIVCISENHFKLRPQVGHTPKAGQVVVDRILYIAEFRPDSGVLHELP